MLRIRRLSLSSALLAYKYSRVALPPSEENQNEQKPAESEGNNFANLPLLRELDDFARNVTTLLCSGTPLA